LKLQIRFMPRFSSAQSYTLLHLWI